MESVIISFINILKEKEIIIINGTKLEHDEVKLNFKFFSLR